MQCNWQPGRAADLERQWRELSLAEGMSQPRTLSLNFICRAHDAADADRVAQHLCNLGPRHPARVFMVAPGDNPVRIRVAAHPGGSEMAELIGPPGRAAGLIAPLLIGDLPVLALWRGGDPVGDPEFMMWTSLANRVLVDAHRLHLTAGRLATLAAHMPAHTTLGDLTWTRLTPWRQLLGQGLQGVLADPSAIESVTIAAGGIGQPNDSGGSLAATMYAGWMAHRLQWEPGVRTREGLRLNRPHGEPVLLRFEAANSHECLLRRVVVEGGSPRSTVTIEHRGPHIGVTLTQEDTVVGEWTGLSAGESLLRGDEATLCEELSIHSPDQLYQLSLERGLALMAGWEAAAA